MSRHAPLSEPEMRIIAITKNLADQLKWKKNDMKWKKNDTVLRQVMNLFQSIPVGKRISESYSILLNFFAKMMRLESISDRDALFNNAMNVFREALAQEKVNAFVITAMFKVCHSACFLGATQEQAKTLVREHLALAEQNEWIDAHVIGVALQIAIGFQCSDLEVTACRIADLFRIQDYFVIQQREFLDQIRKSNALKRHAFDAATPDMQQTTGSSAAVVIAPEERQKPTRMSKLAWAFLPSQSHTDNAVLSAQGALDAAPTAEVFRM